jgi:hypothetical protein
MQWASSTPYLSDVINLIKADRKDEAVITLKYWLSLQSKDMAPLYIVEVFTDLLSDVSAWR